MRRIPLLESYGGMMTLGFVLGMALGGLPSATKEVSMASLAVLMTISLSSVRLSEVKDVAHVKDAALALAINYLMLTPVILVLGSFFEEKLWWGWVLMAAAPSAISVVPFTNILGGVTSRALVATAVNYLAALAIMPFITILLIGSAVPVDELLIALVLMIAVPLALSRGVMRLNLDKRLMTIFMNISFATLIFAVVGANRSAFVEDVEMVALVIVASAARTFGTGLGTEFWLRSRKVRKSERISNVLFASYKNLGLTATLAVALFEPMVAVPATICIVLEIAWVMFLLRFYPGFPDVSGAAAKG